MAARRCSRRMERCASPERLPTICVIGRGSADPSRQRPFRIGWFHHGADIDQAAPTRGLPKDAARNLAAFAARPSFLMVGTIEPRKGHLQVLDAFDQLWSQGVDVNLIIAGAEGWQHLPQDMRRTIPQIVARLRSHPERGRRLFWVNRAFGRIFGKNLCCFLLFDRGIRGRGLWSPAH